MYILHGIKRYAAQLSIAFGMSLLVFSIQTNHSPATTAGQLLVDLFGGLEWSEEMDANGIIMYMLRLIPAMYVSSVCLTETFQVRSLVCYRMRSMRCWYRRYLLEAYSLLFTVWLLQVLAAFFVGTVHQARGWNACYIDAEGYTVFCTALILFSPLLYLLKLVLLNAAGQLCCLLLQKGEAFTLGFLLPEIFSLFAFSNPYAASGIWHLANAGMLKRIIAEPDGIGLPLPVALLMLSAAAALLILSAVILSGRTELKEQRSRIGD